ncbi:uncharacterized protein LOC112559859 [Pomacea canaliculata]|uniref:uncharacterized protein LOC112559859 n=1 Tax=Pomacea canaliculata TaxID=400727 RepID=UPI000D72DF82|nr:uncharacterized protein LOC112559859 [Pomacea canaliculata]
MEIVKRNSTQLSPDQDLHSVTLRTSRTSCRQVHVYSPSTLSHLARCSPERLNPSRFSDPLHRATLLRRSLALTLPQRMPKAYSWYLDNRFPWKREHSRPLFEDVPCSLFGSRGSGHTYLRRVPPIYLIPSHDDLQDRGARREEVCLPDGWADRSSDASGRWRLWGTRSDRTPSPDRLSPYTGSLRSRRSLSPGFSHRFSPVFGDKLPPLRSDLPPSGLSPRSSHLLQLSPSGLSPRSSRVLQWINRNYPSSTSCTHSGTRASPSSTISINSKDDDTSIGSQTDDDFVFVSCSQLVQGLANLSILSHPDSPPARQQEVSGTHDRKPQRPVFTSIVTTQPARTTISRLSCVVRTMFSATTCFLTRSQSQ